MSAQYAERDLDWNRHNAAKFYLVRQHLFFKSGLLTANARSSNPIPPHPPRVDHLAPAHVTLALSNCEK